MPTALYAILGNNAEFLIPMPRLASLLHYRNYLTAETPMNITNVRYDMVPIIRLYFKMNYILDLVSIQFPLGLQQQC